MAEPQKLLKTLPEGAFLVLSKLLQPTNALGKDWRMLAGIMGFTVEEIQYFSVDSDPVRKVLTKWSMLHHEQATTDKLVRFLEEMGRMDAIHDIKCYIGR